MFKLVLDLKKLDLTGIKNLQEKVNRLKTNSAQVVPESKKVAKKILYAEEGFTSRGKKSFVLPRPFVTRAFYALQADDTKLLVLLDKYLHTDRARVDGFYLKAGHILRKAIRTQILRARQWTSLAPATIKRKGHNLPLRDTREMYKGLKVLVASIGK